MKKKNVKAGSCSKHNSLINKLRKENKSLKETCEVLADKKVMHNIEVSLRQIKMGRGIPLATFLSK